MKLMTKNGKSEYVPDIFVESYLQDGYAIFGEKNVVADPAPVTPVEVETVETNIDEVSNAETAEPETPVTPVEVETEPVSTDKHVCPICGKEYSRKANLDKHIAKEHS